MGELLDGGATLYRPGDDPFIPFEFADAAYRYGHSQVRDAYRVNREFGPVPVFPDLMGFGAVPVDHEIDWSLQFDVPGREPAQRSKKIDGKLPRSLIFLPRQISGEDEGSAYFIARQPRPAARTGGRSSSGEAVARELGIEPLSEIRSASQQRAGIRRPRSGSTSSRRRRRWRRQSPRPGRRQDRGRSARRHHRRRPGVLPIRGPILAADLSLPRGRHLRDRGPARPGGVAAT